MLEVTNADAIYAEHSFLAKQWPRKDIKHVYIKRMDEEFLDLASKYPVMYIGRKKRFLYLLDKSGDVVTRVGEGRHFKWMTREELVSQALLRIGEASAARICFAVEDERITSNLTLYKLPKRCPNLAEFNRRFIASQRKELRTAS